MRIGVQAVGGGRPPIRVALSTQGLIRQLEFTIKTPRDPLAKEYKFVCESAQEFSDWKAAIEEAAGKEAYPAAN